MLSQGIAHAADRADETRLFRIIAELFAQTGNVHIDRTVGGALFVQEKRSSLDSMTLPLQIQILQINGTRQRMVT
jgi:hypothetical protein